MPSGPRRARKKRVRKFQGSYLSLNLQQAQAELEQLTAQAQALQAERATLQHRLLQVESAFAQADEELWTAMKFHLPKPCDAAVPAAALAAPVPPGDTPFEPEASQHNPSPMAVPSGCAVEQALPSLNAPGAATTVHEDGPVNMVTLSSCTGTEEIDRLLEEIGGTEVPGLHVTPLPEFTGRSMWNVSPRTTGLPLLPTRMSNPVQTTNTAEAAGNIPTTMGSNRNLRNIHSRSISFISYPNNYNVQSNVPANAGHGLEILEPIPMDADAEVEPLMGTPFGSNW